MSGALFTFEDIYQVEDGVILEIIKAMPITEIANALSHRNIRTRNCFYENLPPDQAENLKRQIESCMIEPMERIKAQDKMLTIIAARPEYKSHHFKSRFAAFEEFVAYLTNRSMHEKPYGFAAEDTLVSSFFNSQNGESMLKEIIKKNNAEKHESFCVPNTKIRLINYSVCPQCERIYSFKALSNYYLHMKPDAAFKKGIEIQLRQDTRMFCNACQTYFLPSLLVVDEVAGAQPKNEVQFLSKMQTLNAIEDHYEALGTAVLSRDERNLIKSDGVSTRPLRNSNEDERNAFVMEIFHSNNTAPKKVLKGIRNDIFLKDLISKPSLIINLLQYSTKPAVVLNLISGDNIEENDVLFGIWL
jgi:hypothetical protein